MGTWTRVAGAVLIVAGAAGCRDKPKRNDVTTDDPTLHETATGAPLTDPGIVVLVNGIHASEISAAQAALQRLQDPSARAYATAMIQDHEKARGDLQAVPVKAESATQPPPQTATMHAVSGSHAALLSVMPSGPAFDRLYVAIQVADHASGLDSLRQWQRVARDGALKQYLGTAQTAVQGHLERAQGLLAHLGGGGSGGPVPPPPPDTAWYKDGAPAKVDSLRRAQGARTSGAPTTPADTIHRAAPKPAPIDTAKRARPRTNP
jgi:predicted outer membrane protein